MFGTYHVELHDFGPLLRYRIQEQLSAAIERSYGPEIKFDFNFKSSIFAIPDPGFVKEILLEYKDNITAMYICLCHDKHTYLLEQALELKKLEQLDIFLYCCKSKKACENEHLVLTMKFLNSFISRYANKLKHLGIHNIELWEDGKYKISNSEIPRLSNLESFSISRSDIPQALSVMRTVNFENITNLKMGAEDISNLTNIDIKYFNIRNLSVLSLHNMNEDLALALLKTSSNTLTRLEFKNIFIDHESIRHIKFSNLKYLSIQGMDERCALTLINNAANTLEEIELSSTDFDSGLQAVKDFKFPCLKRINFNFVSISKLVHSLTNACNVNTKILYNGEIISKLLLSHLCYKTIATLEDPNYSYLY